MPTIRCPDCGKPVRFTEKAGKIVRCLHCGKPVPSAAVCSSPAETTQSPAATADRGEGGDRIREMRRIARTYATETAENDRMGLGCLFGILFPPLGFALLWRSGKKQRRTNEAATTSISALAERDHVTRDDLYSEAVEDPQLASDEKFLKLISESRVGLTKYMVHVEEVAKEGRFQNAVWDQYGLLHADEFEKRKFALPALCGTCGESLADPGIEKPAGARVVLRDSINALQRRTTTILIPQCESCRSRRPVLEGQPRPMPGASTIAAEVAGKPPRQVKQARIPKSVGPLHKRFVEAFLRINRSSTRMEKCACGMVFWTGSNAKCPNCGPT